MSKFVTYGATETLDNDQKFIIDSDRTGPGSITAKDAASSLLSKWAGFETFEEAVQNTISNNQEFIDRDTAIHSETAELKKKIVTTFPAKDASGAVATFESEFEDAPLKSCIVRVEPVQDLHGYDHPWPAGGGKNKINVPDITLSGNAYIFNLTNLSIPAGTYTFSFDTITATTPSFAVSGANGDYLNTSIPNPFTFTVDGEITGIRCYSAAGTYSKIMLEAGSTKTSYAPYENICPITGWTGCEVQRTGKNLCSSPLGRYNWANGVRYSNSAGAYCATENKVKVKGGQTYTVSFINAGTINGVHCSWFCGDTFLSQTNFYNANIGVVTAPNNADSMAITFRNTSAYEGDATVSEVTIEVGSTATPYEPYTGQTYPIAFPTEAGTVYGGTLDVTNGELVVDRAMDTFNGTEEWVVFSNDKKRICMRSSLSHRKMETSTSITRMISNSIPLRMSSEWKSDDDNIMTCRGTAYLSSYLYVFVPPTMFTTTDALKAYLAQTPLQIVYPLANPIHYPLDPIEIKTLLGQNNIWSNTGDTTVEYLMSDVSWYVEKKLRAFQSILAGVEDSTSASKNYSANTYLIFNNDIYRVTKAITTGETIEEGVNVTKTTVAEQLMALAQA